MDKFVKYLEANDFIKIANIESPLIVHSVPGAGKSSLIRSFIAVSPFCEAFTHGVPDLPNLSGRYIKSYSRASESKADFKILDEYNCKTFEGHFDVLIGDPLQVSGESQQAHFIKLRSHRFGKSTCRLLNTLGFQVNSEKEDTVVFSDFYGERPEGTLIAVEPEVINYLNSHGLQPLGPCNIRGSTFKVVSFFHNKPLSELKSADLFVCLSRHSEKLILRSIVRESDEPETSS